MVTLWLLLAFRLLAQDEDPTDVLATLRDRAMANGERLPNYTCVETIQRERFENLGSKARRSCAVILDARKRTATSDLMKHTTTDWLRLDVALTPNREIYSWAGANRFEEGEIDELIPQGAMGTGPYATLLLSLFANRGTRFVFEGISNGTYEYSYSVSQELSRYRFKTGKDWIITGYTGTILIEPKTAKLVRLIVRTDELPPDTSTCEVDTTLEYESVRLGDADYLLPKVAIQRYIGRDGGEAENQMRFARCRQFASESTLSFGPATEGAEKGVRTSAAELPAGIAVSIELATPVLIGEAAAGDRIEGRLKTAIPDVAKEGAIVEGRLMRVETSHVAPTGHTVVLRWENLRTDRGPAPLHLTPDRKAASSSRPRLTVGGVPVLRQRGMEIQLPLPGESRYAMVHLPQDQTTLGHGYVTDWLTDKP